MLHHCHCPSHRWSWYKDSKTVLPGGRGPQKSVLLVVQLVLDWMFASVISHKYKGDGIMTRESHFSQDTTSSLAYSSHSPTMLFILSSNIYSSRLEATRKHASLLH
jgi:hypothetical protein